MAISSHGDISLEVSERGSGSLDISTENSRECGTPHTTRTPPSGDKMKRVQLRERRNMVYGTDGPVEVDELMIPFYDKNCPSLQGKPRIFIFQVGKDVAAGPTCAFLHPSALPW